MLPKSRSKITSLLWLSLALSLVLFAACKKTPEDVRKWEKDKRAPQKMKEFIEGDNSIEVKAEAVMVTVERGEGANLIPILKGLGEDEREKIASEVVTRIEEMIDDEAHGVSVRGKDGAYYLANADLGDELRAQMHTLLIKWVDGDNFWCPMEKIGDADRLRIFEELGAEGLPVIQRRLEEHFDLLKKAKTPERRLSIMEEIQAITNLVKSLNLAEGDQLIASVFVTQMDQFWPDLPEIFGLPFLDNKSKELTDAAQRIMLDPNYSSQDLNGIRDIIINNYYIDVNPKAGVATCAKVMREDNSGIMRWMCARTLVKTTKDEGIDHVFIGLPDDPAKLRMPADHPLAAEFNLDTYFWVEAEAFCRAAGVYLDGKVPKDKLVAYAKSQRMVEKLLGLTCLSYFATDKDMAVFDELAEDPTDIAAWSAAEAPTLGAFVTKLKAETPDRVAQAKERIDAAKNQ